MEKKNSNEDNNDKSIVARLLDTAGIASLQQKTKKNVRYKHVNNRFIYAVYPEKIKIIKTLPRGNVQIVGKESNMRRSMKGELPSNEQMNPKSELIFISNFIPLVRPIQKISTRSYRPLISFCEIILR